MQLGSFAACAAAPEQEYSLRFGRQWGSEGTVEGLPRECEVAFCSHCFVFKNHFHPFVMTIFSIAWIYFLHSPL